jgi:transcription antitermination factor NusG
MRHARCKSSPAGGGDKAILSAKDGLLSAGLASNLGPLNPADGAGRSGGGLGVVRGPHCGAKHGLGGFAVSGKSMTPSSERLTKGLDLEEGERWFAARTLPHRENSAQFNLSCLGFRSFAPRFRRTVRHARQMRNVLAPLFPGYIFVVLDLSRDRWRSVNNTTGVASLIMGVEQPQPVPRGVVEALIARRDSSGTVRLDRDLEVGERARIVSGPFAETLCRIEHLDDRGRVRVLLEIMGGQVLAQLPRSALVVA